MTALVAQIVRGWPSLLFACALACGCGPQGAVVISKIAVAGDGVLQDEDGSDSGWVELLNTTGRPVSLRGYSLTDDPDQLGKWTLPAVTIEAGAYLLVFTSGKDRAEDELHASFELARDGEYLALVRDGGVECAFDPAYPPQIPHFSYAQQPDGGFRYSPEPTPGAANEFSEAMTVEGETFTVDGEISFRAGFTLPSDYLWRIEPGSHLSMADDVWITVHGRVEAQGTATAPIVFAGDGEGVYWRGILLQGSGPTAELDDYWPWLLEGDAAREDIFLDKIDGGHRFEHCEFRNVAPESRCFERENKWMGVLEAYDTALRVSHCQFEDVLYFGGVLVQRSFAVVNHCTFDDETIHKAINATDESVGIFLGNTIVGHRTENTRCADGIWLKSFVGLVASNSISDVGDDGIDTDDCRAVIYDNQIAGPWDDGVDVDNAGRCHLLHNQVSGAHDHGLLASDQSRVIASDNVVSGSLSGLSVRDGAVVSAQGQTLTGNDHGVMVYQNLPCALTDADYSSVKDQLRALTPAEIDAQAYIDGITDPEELIGLLDVAYSFDGDLWMFVDTDFASISEFDDIKKIFKLVDVLGLEYVVTEQTLAHPLTAALHNELYLRDSSTTDNGEDASLWHGFCLDVEEVEFSSTEIAEMVMEQCEPGSCAQEILDGPEIASVVGQARALSDRIVDLYGE